MELGDGQLKEEDSIEALTDLKRSVMQLPLQGYLNEGNGKARLRFVIDNSALTVGFHNREVGIFAKIDNGAERLYAYTNAGNYADWIPSKETPIDGDIFDLHIVIGNAANVTIQTVSGAYATKIEIEEHRTAAELDHPEKSVHKKHLHQDAYESPALTGIPTAPTANKGTSNQQITNTAFVANGLADKFDKTGGVINPAASDEGYTEGIRIATAPNNWSTFILGCKPNTYEGNQAKNGGWGFFRTPANELIIGNRDCMADSSTVVFGSDQKAYFKQMVYAPDFFAYTRCYAQDAFVTTGDGGLYLQKWGGGWYMNESIWIRAYGNKNIYTGGVMKAGGGFEGNLRGRSDATNGIAILTGTITHGGTIPLPDGYTESQCRWMASVAFMNDFATSGDLLNFECTVNEHRKVSCTAEGFEDSVNTIANYIIIGVK